LKRGQLRRLEKLEGHVGADENRLRRLAARLGVEPERMLAAVEGHERELAPHLVEAGITWEGLLLLGKWLHGAQL